MAPDPKKPRNTDRDDTPVHGTPLHEPIETIAHRTRTTATDAREAVVTLNTMRDELRAHVERDEAELKRMSDNIAKIDDHVGNLRAATAGMAGKLDILLEDRMADKHAQAAEAKATAEAAATEVKLAAETAEHERKLAADAAAVENKIKLEDAAAKRGARLKFWSIFGTTVAALTTAIVALVSKCGS
jgi:chromosome segregation ATPase